eukprot:40765-Pleurochrysis_carterae.AAC.1
MAAPLNSPLGLLTRVAGARGVRTMMFSGVIWPVQVLMAIIDTPQDPRGGLDAQWCFTTNISCVNT